MDPNATVSAILEHLEAGDFDQAQQATEDLERWIHGGGFLPSFNQLTEREKLVVWDLFLVLLVSPITFQGKGGVIDAIAQVTHPEKN